jgi:hypothetical protein
MLEEAAAAAAASAAAQSVTRFSTAPQCRITTLQQLHVTAPVQSCSSRGCFRPRCDTTQRLCTVPWRCTADHRGLAPCCSTTPKPEQHRQHLLPPSQPRGAASYRCPAASSAAVWRRAKAVHRGTVRQATAPQHLRRGSPPRGSRRPPCHAPPPVAPAEGPRSPRLPELPTGFPLSTAVPQCRAASPQHRAKAPQPHSAAALAPRRRGAAAPCRSLTVPQCRAASLPSPQRVRS